MGKAISGKAIREMRERERKAQMSRQSFSRVLIPRFTPFRAIEEKGAL